MKKEVLVFNALTRRFLLTEGKGVDAFSALQLIGEMLGSIRVTSNRDRNRVAIAKEQVRKIRSHVRKLQEKVGVLEEQVAVLEETKDKRANEE